MELVRGLWALIVGADPDAGRRAAELELDPTVPPWKLIRDPAALRPLGSMVLRPPSSPALSSDLKLLYVAIELVEIRLLRFLDRVASRSSEKWPGAVNWGFSEGWESAEAKASRTGNAVRLRTWIAVMCRMRRYR
jgi:hypothetical protein